jgi:hypothetical protein
MITTKLQETQTEIQALRDVAFDADYPESR